MSLLFVAYMLIGVLAGLLSGLLGLGGGVVIVPALLALFSWQHFPQEFLMQMATGTSLATIVITALMTTFIQNKQKAVQWAVLKWLIPGMVLGALLGILIGAHIPGYMLKTGFAFFCLLLGIKMIVGNAKRTTIEKRPIPKGLPFFVAVLIGVSSGLLGIGGGVLVIPFLMWYGLDLPSVSATSAASTLPTAASGAVSAMVVGWHMAGLPANTVGYVYWPAALAIGIASIVTAPFGVWLVHRLPVSIIKRIFGSILLVVAWTMMPSF